MNNTKFRVRLTGWMYFFGFSGFYVLLLLVIRAGVMNQSTLFTVPYRAGFLLFSLGVILWGVHARVIKIPGKLLLMVGLFWGLWFLRLFLDVVVLHRTLGMSGWEYLQRVAGMTVLPMLAFGLCLDEPMAKRGFNAVVIASTLFCLLAFLTYGRMADVSGYRMLRYAGYARDAFISPLTLSGQGAMLAGLAAWYVVNRHRRVWVSIAFVGILLVGIYLLFMGESRGPLLALISVFVVLALTNMHSRRPLRRLGLLSFGGMALMVLLMATKGGVQTQARFDMLVDSVRSGDPTAGSGRLAIYGAAIKEFQDSPWLGSSVEESTTQTYPHNSILEAFMATGTLGGIAFVAIFVVGWGQAWRLLKYGGSHGWLAVLFILVAVEGLFSGSVIEPWFWFAWCAVVGNATLGTGARRSLAWRSFPNSAAKPGRAA